MIRGNKNSVRGAVLILVLGMLMVLSVIVSLFLSDVMRDTFMHIQLHGKEALRHHAYNALDALIGHLEHEVVCSHAIDLEHFSLPSLQAVLPETIKAHVKLTDESGKIPLNHTTQKRLKALFCLFGDLWDGQAFMREYWKWLSRKDNVSHLVEMQPWQAANKRCTQIQAEEKDSDKDDSRNKIKFPRILLSYDQLREIDKFREFFFDEKGLPNKKMERLKACSSLWNTGAVNINSANKDVLEVLSKSFSLDLDKIETHLGLTEGTEKHPQRYKSLEELCALGHANLMLNPQKQSEDRESADKKTTHEEGATTYLTVQPHTINACILVAEADVSFQLNVILELTKPEESLTKRQKSRLIDRKGDHVIVRSVSENFL